MDFKAIVRAIEGGRETIEAIRDGVHELWQTAVETRDAIFEIRDVCREWKQRQNTVEIRTGEHRTLT